MLESDKQTFKFGTEAQKQTTSLFNMEKELLALSISQKRTNDILTRGPLAFLTKDDTDEEKEIKATKENKEDSSLKKAIAKISNFFIQKDDGSKDKDSELILENKKADKVKNDIQEKQNSWLEKIWINSKGEDRGWFAWIKKNWKWLLAGIIAWNVPFKYLVKAYDTFMEMPLWGKLTLAATGLLTFLTGGGFLVGVAKLTGGLMKTMSKYAMPQGGPGLGPRVAGGLGTKVMGGGMLLAGVALAIKDGIAGAKLSKEWGTSKAGGVAGAVLGGTDKGISGAFANAGKWALIGAGIGSFVPVIGTMIGGLIGAGVGAIAGFFGGEAIAGLIDSIVSTLLGWFTGIKDFFKESLIATWEGFKDIFENGLSWERVWNIVKANPLFRLGEIFANAINELWKKFKSKLSWIPGLGPDEAEAGDIIKETPATTSTSTPTTKTGTTTTTTHKTGTTPMGSTESLTETKTTGKMIRPKQAAENWVEKWRKSRRSKRRRITLKLDTASNKNEIWNALNEKEQKRYSAHKPEGTDDTATATSTSSSSTPTATSTSSSSTPTAVKIPPRSSFKVNIPKVTVGSPKTKVFSYGTTWNSPTHGPGMSDDITMTVAEKNIDSFQNIFNEWKKTLDAKRKLDLSGHHSSALWNQLHEKGYTLKQQMRSLEIIDPKKRGKIPKVGKGDDRRIPTLGDRFKQLGNWLWGDKEEEKTVEPTPTGSSDTGVEKTPTATGVEKTPTATKRPRSSKTKISGVTVSYPMKKAWAKHKGIKTRNKNLRYRKAELDIMGHMSEGRHKELKEGLGDELYSKLMPTAGGKNFAGNMGRAMNYASEKTATLNAAQDESNELKNKHEGGVTIVNQDNSSKTASTPGETTLVTQPSASHPTSAFEPEF